VTTAVGAGASTVVPRRKARRRQWEMAARDLCGVAHLGAVPAPTAAHQGGSTRWSEVGAALVHEGRCAEGVSEVPWLIRCMCTTITCVVHVIVVSFIFTT
jgi:hypothetical protein